MYRGAIDLRLEDPGLNFWVDVRVRRIATTWIAVADATAERADLAVLLALWPLGPEVARRLA